MEKKRNTVIIELGEIRSTCFVIMPFAPSYQTTYDRVLKPAIEDASLECVRGDEVFTRAQITHEIWKQIRECRLVVAELTGKNPNVLYELGLAHALGKPAIIITRKEDDVPFDLKALRYLYYDVDDPFWGDTLRKQLTEMCRNALEEKEFNNIFDGIVFSGKISTQPFQSPPEPPQQFNLSGVWTGKFSYEGQMINHNWVVHLAQHNDVVSGTIVVSFEKSGKLTVVQQSVSGTIKGNKVSWHGTSYSYLQRGNSTDYDPDSFRGTVEADGSKISGIVSEPGYRGDIILKCTANELLVSK